MAIEHASSGQLVDIHPLGGLLAQAQSFAVCKTIDLEVMRLVIPAQKCVPTHHVRGDQTMQCLEGEVELTVGGQATMMRAGQLLWIAGGVAYSIRALQDASILVTIALPR